MHVLASIWAAMWPNVFAPSFWTLIGVGLSHRHIKRHVDRKHEEIKQHISSKGDQQ